MGYIDNYKFKEILKAGREGDEAAKSILKAIRSNLPQSQLSALVDNYYKALSAPVEEPKKEEPKPVEVFVENANVPQQEVDLTGILDDDLDGVIVDDEMHDDGLVEYLREKVKAMDLNGRTAEYFKKYDEAARKAYREKRAGLYKERLDRFMRQIEREYNDIDKSVKSYEEVIKALPEDGFGRDDVKTLEVYKKIIDDDGAMVALPRYFDDTDKAYLTDRLNKMVAEYGRDNVLRALGGIKYGNAKRWKDLQTQRDEYIGKYTIKLEDLLG